VTSHQVRRTLTITQASAETRLSAHTLRYYERAGLVPKVGRTRAGHRAYTEEDLARIGLVDRLRASGMAVRTIREYVALVRRGDATLDARRRLVERHEKSVCDRIDELQEALRIVRAKLALYEGRSTDPSHVWRLIAAARRRARG
jgi:DNA-binding transcriptional MerR regulator